MNTEPQDKKYPMPRNVRIPEPQASQIQQMAKWRGSKIPPLIYDALREYIAAHYKEFKKEFESLSGE